MNTVVDTAVVSRETESVCEERPTGSRLVVTVVAQRWRGIVIAYVVLTAGLVLSGAPAGLWPALAYVTAACVTLAVVDLRHHRLPDVLTVGSYPVTASLLLIPATYGDQSGAWFRACIACVVVALGLVVLGGMLGYGAGDAKLAGLLAMPLAWHSWGACLAGICAGFLMTSLFGAALCLARRISRREPFAAGPALMAGTYLVLLVAL